MPQDLARDELLSSHAEPDRDISAAECVAIVGQLARQLHELHQSGRLHLAISMTSVRYDVSTGSASLAPPPAGAESFSEGEEKPCPAEWLSAAPIELPRDLPEARRLAADRGIALDPVSIDIYQLGALMCRLLTGDSVQSYLRSPRTKGRAPAALQPIIERALGCRTDRFTSAEQLAAAIQQHDVDAPAPESQLPATAPLESPLPSTTEDTSPSFIAGQTHPDTEVQPAVRDAPAAADDDESGLPFRELGHYEVVAEIGRGGMGNVYRGFERALNRTVAIKVLPMEFGRHDDFVRRFHAEASAAAQLVHPNITQIFFIGEDRGYHYFVMQYVDGESLADLLNRRGRLDVEEALEIVEQALSGLVEAHGRGLVHRDIKPGNLLIDGNSRRVLLADFGLVKALDAGGAQTATGVIMGTVDYISPEQGRGRPVDSRSDLYSLGVMLYQMLSGRLPFEGESATAVIFQHAYESPPPLEGLVADVPPPLAAIIAKLLAKSPDDRHQSAAAVLDDLLAIRAGEPLPSGADRVTRDSDRVPADSAMPTGPERAGDSTPDRRQSAIVEAPRFGDEPLLLSPLPESHETGRWRRVRNRLHEMFHRHAPEFVKELQSTQHQIDGAVGEYERRRD